MFINSQQGLPEAEWFLDTTIDGNPIRQKRHLTQSLQDDIDYSQVHLDVVRSWHNAFSFKEAHPEHSVAGLRQPQLGAVYSIQAHCITSKEPATVVLPTGTGKTETMLSTLVLRRCSKVLIIVPSESLRTQISEKFVSLGILKEIGVVSDTAMYPVVGTLKHIPKSVAAADAFFEKCQVIVATAQLLSQCSVPVVQHIAAYCPYLFVDEAHHREASSWTRLIDYFSESFILQFTATPYRNDGKQLTGKIIFNYSLRQAQRDGYFTYINFVPIQEFHPDSVVADREIARQAVAKLREDIANGYDHILMARVNKISRANQVFKIYSQYSDLNPVQIHTEQSFAERRLYKEQIINKSARIVVCVDMLGEGFDLPELKIAAFHDIRQSLPVTLQLAGRFTRARTDLGEATIFANIADPPTQTELQNLYEQNPDWNHLLRVTSQRMIQSEIDLQDFVAGFHEISEEIPLHNVHIKMSTAIYRTYCAEWTPNNFREGLPNLKSYHWIKHEVNHEQDTMVILAVKKVPLPWLKAEDFQSLEMNLFVIFWDREQELLFINQSANKGYVEKLARSVASGASLIKGFDLFRCMANINRLRLRNVGLNEERKGMISYVMRAGSDVEPAITTAQRQTASRGNLFGSGYENGKEVTIGVTANGRIWAARECDLNEYVQWCRSVGVKVIDETLDPSKILEGVIKPVYLTTRPELVPVSIDWNELIYKRSEKAFSVVIDNIQTSLHHVELKICAMLDLETDLQFEICHGDVSVKYALHLDEAAPKGYRFVNCDEQIVLFNVGRGEQLSAELFFEEHPPKIFFADSSTLTGNKFIDFSRGVQPYNPSRIEGWDWSDVDITVESQRIAKQTNSIQYKVIQELLKDDYNIVFDDDDSGEAADVVTIRDHESYIEVELYHCKFSSKPFAGCRVSDLYEVCGQAQKSIRWSEAKPKALFDHLLRREPRVREGDKYSRFERGDQDTLVSLRNKSRQYPVKFKIYVVQPGLASNPSSSQLELLNATENHLMETYQIPLQVIGNIISSR